MPQTTAYPAAIPRARENRMVKKSVMEAASACTGIPVSYFFFSAFQMLREMARPQKGQKFIR